MPRHIAFLRAINVGGRTVTKEALREPFEAMGFANVETFIASGNVIFESRAMSSGLGARIEAALGDALGYEVATFLRTEADVMRLAIRSPFSVEVLATAKALNVAFGATPLTPSEREALSRFESDNDTFRVEGREVHWLCRTRQSESKFSNAQLERALKRPFTIRGIDTIKKLAEKLAAKPVGRAAPALRSAVPIKVGSGAPGARPAATARARRAAR